MPSTIPARLGAIAMTKMSDMHFEYMRANAGNAAVLLKSMSNVNRLLILCQLVEGERSVTALQKNLPLSQSALSQHLALLRREGLVNTRREAQSIIYSLDSEKANAVLVTLYDVYCGPNAR